MNKGLFIFSVVLTSFQHLAEAATCSTVPENTYNFVKTQLIAKIKRDKLTLAKAKDLSYTYSKYLGMMLEESGGDAAKIAIHGKERSKGSYTKIKDWVHEDNILAEVKEVDANIETFISRANYQTNFGISQISPDQAAYNGDPHKFVRARLAEVQDLAKSDPAAAVKRCGANYLFKDSADDLAEAFKKISSCNPVIDVKYGRSSSTPVNDNTRLRCFARIAMYCPGMHFDIMNGYPKKNWGTAGAKVKCTSALEQEVQDHFKGGTSDESGSDASAHD